MPVFHEILPETYLLIPTDSDSDNGNELLQALRHARRSGKTSITLDCRYLAAISPTVISEITRLQSKWRKHHISLLIAQTTDKVRQAFS
ncbi:hypothetical protein [Hymenobacter jejuensis]|uniref:hypothetical protein n=1 Tax=Hymenobacter jejuensis TaxID=2502781 RepID=UPI0013FD003F|nr:hypothetical protein [Hymenobacter jejuensis]